MHAGHLEVFIFSESLTETNGCVHHNEASASCVEKGTGDALDKIGLFQSVWAI